MLFRLLVLLVLVHTGCKIDSINYAQDVVKIVRKTKTMVDGRAAVDVTLQNTGDAPAYDVVLTVKAKRNSTDVDAATQKIEMIPAGENRETLLVFKKITTHSDYDFLTFALRFSDSD